MILVLLGTQDKPFERLLKQIDKCVEEGIIKDKIIVQAGCTKYSSNNMEIFDLIEMDEFDKLIKKADLVITHGGVGSIINSLNKNKLVIATPRLAKYKEHVNDHQVQIIEKFDEGKHIIGLMDLTKLDEAIEKSKTFKPVKYKSNQNNMIKLVEKLINEK